MIDEPQDFLSTDTNEPESPAWHESIIAERIERINSGKARFSPLKS